MVSAVGSHQAQGPASQAARIPWLITAGAESIGRLGPKRDTELPWEPAEVVFKLTASQQGRES